MPVAADCQPAGPIEEALAAAPVVFVGTAVDVVRSMARFEVHEVWAGAVANGVEVHGLTSGVEFGEDDRRWEAGTKYLVIPFIEGQVLRDSICTATTEWNPELELLRPENARVVGAEEAGGAGVPPALVLAGLVILLLAGASAIAFRRR
ncbi:MAG: hypothetical protein ACXWWQ_09200 [Candidatus Limnocylindria bacterium]